MSSQVEIFDYVFPWNRKTYYCYFRDKNVLGIVSIQIGTWEVTIWKSSKDCCSYCQVCKTSFDGAAVMFNNLAPVKLPLLVAIIVILNLGKDKEKDAATARLQVMEISTFGCVTSFVFVLTQLVLWGESFDRSPCTHRWYDLLHANRRTRERKAGVFFSFKTNLSSIKRLIARRQSYFCSWA